MTEGQIILENMMKKEYTEENKSWELVRERVWVT